ncbi:hypothetical protein [Streptomyces europaeiscabiei]|uniref:hypothetical protein n=1 Tax=Streptomyces europaeiscabiei TaxID=146819 RepID=UPI0029A86528|nr:hypothetical protein [Streptomyces europaeiscabiei]MDX3867545.1 hypothetical protein [Streptomyces europaeiscabiei]MDX3875417.1 hypothetical protein [Streptomyces europaeiscabiei]
MKTHSTWRAAVLDAPPYDGPARVDDPGTPAPGPRPTLGAPASGEAARFDHPLVRAAIAETVVGPVRLAAGHARAAELLQGELRH